MVESGVLGWFEGLDRTICRVAWLAVGVESFLACGCGNGAGGVGRTAERGLHPRVPIWKAKSLGQGPPSLEEDPSVVGVAAEVSSCMCHRNARHEGALQGEAGEGSSRAVGESVTLLAALKGILRISGGVAETGQQVLQDILHAHDLPTAEPLCNVSERDPLVRDARNFTIRANKRQDSNGAEIGYS